VNKLELIANIDKLELKSKDDNIEGYTIIEQYIYNKKTLLMVVDSINVDDLTELLDLFNVKKLCETNNTNAVVILADTNKRYGKKDLYYFDNVSIFVSFVLLDNQNDLQLPKGIVAPLAYSYRRLLKQISKSYKALS